jgi:hypothetical protein
MKRQFGLVTVLALIATFVFGSAGTVGAAGTTVVVSPTNQQGWFFYDDTHNLASGPTVTGSFVDGPGHPPLGTGSANLTVGNVTDGQALLTLAHAGTRLDAITKLQYSTYVSSSANPPALDISLQVGIDYDATDANTGFQGRLVFEPYQNGTVVVTPGTWQTWNALAGTWWASKTTAAGSNGLCPQSAPCTWAQVLINWPNAGINANAGVTGFKAGSNWAAFNGNVDAFTIGVSGADTTYDFENHTVATDKNQCKDGGWQTFNPPTGPYKNQGQCVSSTNH